MQDKNEIIKTVNEIKKTKLADLKSNPVENSSGTNHRALMTYNAMLDNITISTGTKTDIECAGITWTLRLLNTDEFINIRKEVIKECKAEQLFDEWYSSYLTVIKTIAQALTPNPFKIEGKALFNLNDLKQVNYDVLMELYKRYIDFVDMATKKAEEFTDEELEALKEIIKKKPEVYTEFDRRQFLILMKYYPNYCAQLEKMLAKDQIS